MSHAGPSTAALQTSGTTKRLSTHGKPPAAGGMAGSAGGLAGVGAGVGGVGLGKEVLNPGELCGFVDTLLSQLETRFDEMSEQVMYVLVDLLGYPWGGADISRGRMNEMSTRIDNLENTIQDLMSSDIDVPAAAQDPLAADPAR